MHRILGIILIFVLSQEIGFAQMGVFYPSERFSSGLINDICQDQYGYIWIATDYGLNKFDGYRFTTYLHHPADTSTVSSNIIGCVYCDSNGQLWVGTSKGLDRYDYASDEFLHYRLTEHVAPRITDIRRWDDGLLVGTAGHGLYELSNGKVRRVNDLTIKEENFFFNRVMKDSHGRIWKCGFGNVVTMKDKQGVHRMTSTLGDAVNFAEHNGEMLVICLRGIQVYRDGGLQRAAIDLSVFRGEESVIRRAISDSQGTIYIGTRGDGVYRLSEGSNRLERVECNSRDIDLNTAKIWAMAEDRQGNLWLGCQSKGLLMLPHRQSQFQLWSLAALGENISSTVTSVCEGTDGMTWCTVQGNGVYGFNSQGRITAHPAAPSTAEMIYRDRSGRYWIGTDNALYAYNPLTGSYQQKAAYACDKFNDMTDVGDGWLYISTFSRGFCAYNPETGELRNVGASQRAKDKGTLCNNWIMAMMPDREGRLWLATSSGVACYDPKADSFRPFGWNQLLDGVMCYSLCETSRGHILIGTEQGLYIYEPGKREAEIFREGDGLRNKVVGYIVEANNGDIWCSTAMGLWQLDVKANKFIGHISGNGLTAKEYINCVGLHTDGDIVCFANNEGLTVFRPAEVASSAQQLPPVSLTGFMIAGKPANTRTESDGRQVADGPTITTDRYRVSYLDNTLSLEFSLLDFENLGNTAYEYRISGGDWVPVSGGQNSIMLSHLQPGTYRVEVRASVAGTYSDTKTITVEVTPPWYRSPLAYSLYLLLGLVLAGLAVYYLRRRQRQQLEEEKMKFLINATHDIRSPLTLIIGPLAKLKALVTDEKGRAYLDTIDRNAQKLMTLVNQILDERKIDKGQMQLHCQETNIVELISGTCKLYQYEAQQRNISFTFDHELNNVPLWVDRMNFDKVISNLLSNAFKYTTDGGEVNVRVSTTERDVEIRVTDNGMGFKDGEPTKHLFERFHQGSNTVNLNTQGTGIGLNLCRSIVQMHGGRIKAGNRTDGQRGACFSVVMPQGNKHLRPEQIVENKNRSEILSTTNSSKTHKSIRVMLVDDDQEIPDFIRFELGSFYKFTVCPNGKEALKTLLTDDKHYDIVVSDVMMPEMDGITLLKRIKENPHTSEIPVILLTSKTAVEYRLEGLKKGADAYLAKPFDMEELHVQIDNLVGNMRRLKGVFTGASTQKDKVEDVEVKGNDEQLMERIMKSINANLSDPDYNVEALAKDVGLSRAQLHRKMKDMTGLATGKFVRDIRMQQAGKLLREGRVNVSQVAYSVGFNDQAHFSTVFKTYYGVTPSEYTDQVKA